MNDVKIKRDIIKIFNNYIEDLNKEYNLKLKEIIYLKNIINKNINNSYIN